jgi:hypothetical protein
MGAAGVLWCVIQAVLGTQPVKSGGTLPGGVRLWQLAQILISLVLSGMLITGAVAALGLKSWGRRLLIRTAIASAGFQIVSVVLAATWTIPAVKVAVVGTSQTGPFPSAGGLLHVTSVPLLIMKVLVVVSAMEAIVVILTRPKVKQAFTPSPA